jgi:hypothetical protein
MVCGRPHPWRRTAVTYVIAVSRMDIKDRACVEECPVDCIREGTRSHYVQPDECIDRRADQPAGRLRGTFGGDGDHDWLWLPPLAGSGSLPVDHRPTVPSGSGYRVCRQPARRQRGAPRGYSHFIDPIC